MSNIYSAGNGWKFLFVFFGVISLFFMMYYLSATLFHFTTPRQFPISSFERFPLTFVIFPAELFSFFFAAYFVYTIISHSNKSLISSELRDELKVPVAILLPVYHEPEEVMERTIKACKGLVWAHGLKIYLLDDSKNSGDKEVVNKLARKYKLTVVRRSDRKGFKAGNINNAVKKFVKEDYFAVFDSDQAPRNNFVSECMRGFVDSGVGFVQVPQHFVNDSTPIERAAKIGTNIFYRAQCVSKGRDGAIPFCGTNFVVRKNVFLKVGGYSYYTATEDIDIGIRINALGFRGVYVPKILVDGYAPQDWNAYSSQQYRWANGNLAILRQNLTKLFGGNFSFKYQVHMFFTLGWWLIGLVSLAYILVPILSVLFGWGTHHTWLPTALLFFLFFHVILGISMIYASLKSRVPGDDVRFRDALLEYSLITNSLFIYTRAAINALVFKRFVGFVRTDKRGSSSGLWQIKWNLLLGVVSLVLSLYTLYNAMLSSDFQQIRTFLPISLWLLFYALIMFSSVLFVGKKRVVHGGVVDG